MSGLIGSAGSKSGIIGETEIDYEEGTWTPTFNNVDARKARYIKVGKWVHCWGWIRPSGGNDGLNKAGLPFTTMGNEDGQDNALGGGTVTFQNQASGETWSVLVSDSSKTWNFYYASTSKELTSGASAHFFLSYRIA